MARILVVDDSDDMRRLFTDVLSRDHHEIVEAANGVVGFERLMSRQFDLAILDVMMPDLDGLTLCRMLRDVPGFGAFPIVVVSGASTEAAALASGADAFLNKPFRPSRLLAIISDLIANGRADRPDDDVRVVMPGMPDLARPDLARPDAAVAAVAPATSRQTRGAGGHRRTNGQVSTRSAGAPKRRVKTAPDQSPRDSG